MPLSLTLSSTFCTCARNPGDGGFDRDAPLLLLGERGALPFQAPLLGDVVVGDDPSGTRQWTIGERNRAPVGHFDDLRRRPAGGDLAQKRGDVLLGIVREGPRGDPP